MAGLSSLRKGKSAEREVIRLLQPVIDEVTAEIGAEGLGATAPAAFLKRNLMQSGSGGYDLVGIDWLALEVKRHETLNVNAWWDQTKRQAGAGQVPVLFYRQNREAWKIKMFGSIPAGDKRVTCPVVIDLAAFLVWFKIKLKKELTE